MAYPNQKNVLHVFVGKEVNATTDATLIDNYADLNDGEIAVVDLDNKVINQAGSDIGAAETFRFVTRYGTYLIYSPWIKANKITSMISASYSGAQQQVTYLGYVGSGTGNIEAIDENEYIVRILIEGTTAMFGNKQMYKFGAYKSGASATSAEVAIGLVDNLYYNFKREPLTTIQFDAICNATGTAGTNAAGVVTATVGENYVTYTDTGNADNCPVIVAGDYVRGGTSLTSPVYKVISGSSTAAAGGTVYLDRPITAAFGAHANDNHTITAAEGIAATWGIVCTGIAWSNFRVGVFEYGVTRFKVEPQGCGSSAVTYSTAAAEGKGVYGQIAQLEYFAQGNLGNKWRIGVPPPTMYANAASGKTYETIAIKYSDSQGESITGTTPASHGEILIACVVNSVFGDALFLTLDHIAPVAMTAWS
jgi:hypothetical protein